LAVSKPTLIEKEALAGSFHSKKPPKSSEILDEEKPLAE
jgi:hypothetical protein